MPIAAHIGEIMSRQKTYMPGLIHFYCYVYAFDHAGVYW